MIYYLLIVSKIFLLSRVLQADSSIQCGDDWDSYKDEKCFKVFDSIIESYDDAKTTCSKNDGSSLVSIRSQEEQDFILNLVHSKHGSSNNIWIGLTLQQNKLKWTDNITENYTNWDNSNPRNISGYECVVMQMVIPYGKWINEPCNQLNLVVCQKSQNWLFSYLQNTVIELRKSVDNISKQLEYKSKLLDNSILELNHTKRELENTNRKQDLTEKRLETAETNLSKLRQQINESIPVGTIAYFSNTSAPLGWLKANGQRVSRTTYANLFDSIGTRFGSGDGSTTFTLPDLRGEFIRGWSDGRDVDNERSFGSFQWGSNIPLAGHIAGQTLLAYSSAEQARWRFSASGFDDGFEIDVPSGQTRDGMTFPNDGISNLVGYVKATDIGNITTWNVMKGTRPRNLALLACIKY